MAWKKVLAGTAIISFLLAGIYVMYFQHGSPEDILAANRRSTLRKTHSVKDNMKRLHVEYGKNESDEDFDDSEEYDDEEDETDIVKSSQLLWDRWIEKNNHVSIGEIYDKCEGDDRVTIGRVILIQDKVKGGVASVTYVNHTWDHVIDDGEVLIDVKYNNKNLYNNKWELCTIDEDEEERIVFCPIKSNEKHYVKQMKIPNYLPKGRYQAKVWLLDQEEVNVACGFADFTI
ncbi:unnamed protein product [Owenia fusiformis]|uniref:Uncharacterized protein n=1 Tax=Owenia fusiformis TaxID=6347 RepID=A0A8J1UTL8_OWEFU|nr:unnamed protein product [Owenia fusiformis]